VGKISVGGFSCQLYSKSWNTPCIKKKGLTVIIIIYTMIVSVIRSCILVSVCSREVIVEQVDLKAFLVNWETSV
jgi:hypothetical protein